MSTDDQPPTGTQVKSAGAALEDSSSIDEATGQIVEIEDDLFYA